MKRSLKTRKLIAITILAVLTIVLQLLSNYVHFGPVSITLALIPIVVGAIIYGPLAGFVLGAAAGLVVFVAPSTIALFWPVSIILTLLVCVFKMGLAGLASGLIFKFLGQKNKTVAVILSSIIVPLVNTGLFAVAAYLFYYDLLASLAPEGSSIVSYLFLGFIGFNFIIEFLVNSILSPVVLRLANIAIDKYGFGNEEKELESE